MDPPNEFAGWNSEAAVDNKFMNKQLSSLAQYNQEFYKLHEALHTNGIRVILPTAGNLPTPDSIYPNNWLSVHANGEAVIYPMKVENRRMEIREDIIELLKSEGLITDVYDMSSYVNENKFFEGTGVLVLDRENRIAYVNESQRSSAQLAVEWCEHFGYELILFQAVDSDGHAIYHTNVLLSIGQNIAIICSECIHDDLSRKQVLESLVESKKDIIEISMEQMNHFCANVLELRGGNGKGILAMSDRAFKNFTEEQIQILENKHSLTLIHPDIENIEKIGGGGVRCMIAEVFTKSV